MTKQKLHLELQNVYFFFLEKSEQSSEIEHALKNAILVRDVTSGHN